MGEKRNSHRFSEGTPEGKGSLGRRKRRWEDNIAINVTEIEWAGLIWLRIGTSGWIL
jgi:hypothetical protein